MTYYKWSKTAASNSNADSTINWAEGQAPSTVNDSSRAVMAAAAKSRDDWAGSLTTSGTLTAYTLTSNQVFDSLANMDGQMVVFKAHTTSGAAPTLNVDTLGAKALHSVAGTALPTGALLEGGIYAATYDNTNSRWVVHGLFGALSLTSVTTTGGVTVGNDLTVTAGGATITAGGLTVTAGGAAITGNSSITGTLSMSSTITVAAGGIDVTGNSIVRSALALSSTLSVAGATTISNSLAVTDTTTLTGALTANASAGVTARNTVKAFGEVVSGSASGSFNVASVVDNGVTHTITFSDAMANANYVVLLTPTGGTTLFYSGRTTSSFVVEGRAGTIVDPGNYSFMVLSNE